MNVSQWKFESRRARAAGLAWVVALLLVASTACETAGQFLAPEAYATAQEYVRKSEAARAEIGDVQSFAPVPANVDVDPIKQSGTLDFEVTGTKGKGTVHVEIARDGEAWAVRSASLTGPSGKRVPLR
jgi:hypothetical protein